MSNTLLTSSIITKEALRLLEAQLVFTKQVNRQYDSRFAVDGAKVGSTIYARKPPRYVGRRGATAVVEDITEQQVPVVLDTQYGVDLEVTSADLTLSIDMFSKRILAPAISRIAHMIDGDGLALVKRVPNAVGTPGTTPTALSTYQGAGVLLDNESAPDDVRYMDVTSKMNASIVDSLKGLFNSQRELADQYVKGRMGSAIGFEWDWSQNIQTLTLGARGGTPLVNGAGQTGASLVTDGFSISVAGLLKVGDRFTIANVYAVNPATLQSTGDLRIFVVTADASSNGSGQATLSISPSIVTTGAFQNVTAAPADNAAITFIGTAGSISPQGVAFHPDAFAFVTTDLYMPKGVDMSGRVSDEQLGISMRFVRQYQAGTDKLLSRLDVLGGWTLLRPELAVAIYG